MPITDELKTAMVLRCVSGALKTQLSLQLDESATYPTVREAILRWDRSQQKWHNLLQGDSSEAVPMEIDRLEATMVSRREKVKIKERMTVTRRVRAKESQRTRVEKVSPIGTTTATTKCSG